MWGRFSMRFSNGGDDVLSTSVIRGDEPHPPKDEATVCPVELEVSENCRNCGQIGLCWHSAKRIVFVEH